MNKIGVFFNQSTVLDMISKDKSCPDSNRNNVLKYLCNVTSNKTKKSNDSLSS